LRIVYIGDDGLTQEVEVTAADTSERGFGLESPTSLTIGLHVSLRGQVDLGHGREAVRCQAIVCWCVEKEGGRFQAGLALLPSERTEQFPDTPEDFYDTLQVSDKADPDTIHRVFRILAQRYHPDNRETGSADLFRAISVAYGVLSDPEKRASYDVQRNSAGKLKRRIFSDAAVTRGAEAEKRKRAGILSLLYTKRLNDPQQPSMNLREMEDLLACPKEHLEFSLWYLKERGMVLKGDSASYSITVSGVDEAEKTQSVAATTRPVPAPGHLRLESNDGARRSPLV
jgi:hypothetical protein